MQKTLQEISNTGVNKNSVIEVIEEGNLCTSSISHILAKRVEASLGINREIRAQVPSPIF